MSKGSWRYDDEKYAAKNAPDPEEMEWDGDDGEWDEDGNYDESDPYGWD